MAEFFVRRPIVAMVIAIVTILGGLVALGSTPVAQYPEVVPPMIQVSTTFTGASAVDVESSVATPLEQQINGVERSIYMRSVNANDGTLRLEVSFEVGTNLDTANLLTQNRVQQAVPGLPPAVKDLGVAVRRSLTFPLMLIALRSPGGTYDNSFLSNYASINLNDRLARVTGVGQVLVFGGSDYAMRIWLDPDRLAERRLSVPDVIAAVREQNQLVPAGQIGGPPAVPGTAFTYAVRTRGTLRTAEEFGGIVVRTDPDGSEVRLSDLARIELGSTLYNAGARLDGKPAAIVAVFQSPGSNALDVARGVRAALEEARPRFPKDLDYSVSLDTTRAVDAGIEAIEHTLVEALLLVVLVVFLFLRNLRATLIPILVVPVALIGAFVFFPLLGFSVNVLSLLGLVLAIGLVVDDAIVVVEAVTHHVEQGMTPRDATLLAMKEVSGPIVAITLVLIAVFVPVAFMPGLTGRFYQQFALTIALSMALSAVNALTLSPALCAMLLRPAGAGRSPLRPLYRLLEKGLDRLTAGYVGVTRVLLRKATVGLLLFAATLPAILALGRSIPGGFIPSEDQGYLLAALQLPDAASLERSDAAARKVEAVLAADPAVGSFTTITGFSLLTRSYASNTCFFFVPLRPWGERAGDASLGVAPTVARLSRSMSSATLEGTAFAFGPPEIPGLGSGSGFTVFVQDRAGGTPSELAEATRAFVAALARRPEIGRATTTFRADVPQILAEVDRDRALKLGVPIGQVNATLGALLGGTYVNDFTRFGRTYRVYVQAAPEFRRDADGLRRFAVRAPDDAMVPIDQVVSTRPTTGPEFTNRFNLFRAAEVSGVPAPGRSSAEALAAIDEVAKETLPPGYGHEFANISFQERQAAGSGPRAFGLAIVLVFLILAALYESWALPFSVLLGTPFAVLGAFAGLAVARRLAPDTFVNNVFAQIGLVLLIGLSAKNAILIVEFARRRREEGVALLDATLEAARLRFRPILMTSFAFILGVLPLVRASGAGAEARRVIGVTVFSGLLVATVLGVALVPVLFVTIERVFRRRPPAAAGATPLPPEAPSGPAH